MQFPCEILVKKILPAIRAIMVKALNEKHNKSQREIANLLGITQPSVSYYLHGERGSDAIDLIKETEKTYETLLGLVEKLVQAEINTNQLLKELCSICLEIRPIYIKRVCPDKFEFLKEWNVCFIE
ncbi:MAG TPA: helix-turn-helix domain-containing protein [Candidatus Deferrimicrobium sp.]|nr:helix-turn-helix domain-containing protein [Candidatus Deferrimicrobium sp.]